MLRAGWDGRVTDACRLPSVNYGGPDDAVHLFKGAVSGVLGRLTVPTDGARISVSARRVPRGSTLLTRFSFLFFLLRLLCARRAVSCVT